MSPARRRHPARYIYFASVNICQLAFNDRRPVSDSTSEGRALEFLSDLSGPVGKFQPPLPGLEQAARQHCRPREPSRGPLPPWRPKGACSELYVFLTGRRFSTCVSVPPSLSVRRQRSRGDSAARPLASEASRAAAPVAAGQWL